MSQLNHNIIIEMNVFKCMTLNFHMTYFWIKLDSGGFLKNVLEEWVYYWPWTCPQVWLTCKTGESGRLGPGVANSAAPDLTFIRIPSSCPSLFLFSPSHSLPNSLPPHLLHQPCGWLVFPFLRKPWIQNNSNITSPALRNQGGVWQMTL